MKALLEETSLAMMEQCVKNYWLEDFYYWTQELGGYTAEMMGEILKTKADTMAINLILNSFNTVYNDVMIEGVINDRSNFVVFVRVCFLPLVSSILKVSSH